MKAKWAHFEIVGREYLTKMCECKTEPIKCSYRRHCIHMAIRCINDRLKYQNTYEDQKRFIAQLIQNVKEYLAEHPDEALEL